MALSDIAAGLEVTTEQCDRGVAAVDDTGADLPSRLEPFESELPTTPEAAATLVESYTAGRSVGDCAHRAGVTAVDAAKTLHLLGVDGVTPLTPQGRRFVADWLAGDLSRTDARQLAGVSDAEFALGAFVETHDPLADARDAVEGALAPADHVDGLADTRSSVSDLL